MKFLEINNVVKQYSGQLALNDVSLIVPRGSVYGLLGPNGAGKSSTLRILLGLDRPSSGTALIGGKKYCDIEINKKIKYAGSPG